MAKVYKNAGLEAARIAGRHREMDHAAAKVLSAIKAEAAAHTDTGAFAASFSVSDAMYTHRMVKDRVISSDDPNALSIEYGHLTRRGAAPGHVRRQVAGLMIVNKAVDRLR